MAFNRYDVVILKKESNWTGVPSSELAAPMFVMGYLAADYLTWHVPPGSSLEGQVAYE